MTFCTQLKSWGFQTYIQSSNMKHTDIINQTVNHVQWRVKIKQEQYLVSSTNHIAFHLRQRGSQSLISFDKMFA